MVQSAVTWTLAAEVENLTLTGTTAINGTGNAMDNLLTGNSAINTLTGGAGNDWLDGLAGADKLLGGLGNDTYVVDNAGDLITENLSEGIDTANALVTYTLVANVENLTLTGTAAVNGTGNTQDNILMGNSAINTLTGGAGNDTMSAGAGNDILVGGAGKDVLTGGAGTDVFDFNLIAESGVGVAAYDVITEFLAGTDRIDLLTIDANSAVTGDQAFAFIGTGAFTAAGQLRYSFDGTNTLVQGNIDAALGVDFEILLLGNQTLVAANFVL
jgi:Ca2+-binding RTX toxin-like protein